MSRNDGSPVIVESALDISSVVAERGGLAQTLTTTWLPTIVCAETWTLDPVPRVARKRFDNAVCSAMPRGARLGAVNVNIDGEGGKGSVEITGVEMVTFPSAFCSTDVKAGSLVTVFFAAKVSMPVAVADGLTDTAKTRLPPTAAWDEIETLDNAPASALLNTATTAPCSASVKTVGRSTLYENVTAEAEEVATIEVAAAATVAAAEVDAAADTEEAEVVEAVDKGDATAAIFPITGAFAAAAATAERNPVSEVTLV